MKIPGNLAVIAALVILQFAPPAFSHTTLTETIPGSDSVLAQSPAVVEIRFAHAARLTSVVLLGEDSQERRLDFTPGGSAVSFKLPEPDLGPGRNEIRWKALSGDGHVISGSLIYTIKPDAANTD